MPNLASRTQHAIRLLALLRGAGEPATAPGDPLGAVLAVRSGRRLQALDFWLRSPDYLADEILTEVEAGRLEDSYIAVADGLLTNPEPALHHYPMPKWLYGAYERLDDAFALLEAYGLAVLRKSPAPHNRNQYFLLPAGVQAADSLESDDSALNWYPRQVRLLMLVARDQTGYKLKERQYQQKAYAQAELQTDIAPIGDLVRRRLASMRRAS